VTCGAFACYKYNSTDRKVRRIPNACKHTSCYSNNFQRPTFLHPPQRPTCRCRQHASTVTGGTDTSDDVSIPPACRNPREMHCHHRGNSTALGSKHSTALHIVAEANTDASAPTLVRAPKFCQFTQAELQISVGPQQKPSATFQQATPFRHRPQALVSKRSTQSSTNQAVTAERVNQATQPQRTWN